MAPVGLHPIDAVQGPLIAGRDGQYPAVAGDGGIVLSGGSQCIAGGDQSLDRGFAARRQVQFVGQVVRSLGDRLSEFCDARFVVAALDLGEAVAVQLRGGATPEQGGAHQHDQSVPDSSVHHSSPTARVC
jgi:hypothetical protein